LFLREVYFNKNTNLEENREFYQYSGDRLQIYGNKSKLVGLTRNASFIDVSNKLITKKLLDALIDPKLCAFILK